ncbi:hypothetical protein F5051DRAFT_431613 [Lentinula edodes]|nr:hypothetical protein F5051DRAFT_431613 [Lentinula edodes]
MDVQYEYVYYNNPVSESDRHKRQSRNPYSRLKTLAQLGEPEWVTEELKRTFRALYCMRISREQKRQLNVKYGKIVIIFVKCSACQAQNIQCKITETTLHCEYCGTHGKCSRLPLLKKSHVLDTMDLSEDQYNWLMIWYKVASRDGVLPRITKVKNSGTNKERFDATLNDTYYLQNDSRFRSIDPVPYANMYCSAEQDCESSAGQDYESNAEQYYESSAEQDYEFNAEQDYESSAEQDYEFNAEQDYESSAEQDHEHIAEQESRPEQEYESSTEHQYRTSPEQVYRSTAQQVYRPADAQTHDISAGHVYDLYGSSEEQVYGISAGRVYDSYDSREKQVHGLSAGHAYGSYDSSTKQVYGTDSEQFNKSSADHAYRPNAEQLHRSSAERVYTTSPEQTYNSSTISEEWQPMVEYYSKRKFGSTDKGKIDSIVSVHASNDGGVGHILSSVDSRAYDDSIHETLDSMSSRNPSKVSSANNTRTIVQMSSSGCSSFSAHIITVIEAVLVRTIARTVPSDILAELDELVRREAFSADEDVSGRVYDNKGIMCADIRLTGTRRLVPSTWLSLIETVYLPCIAVYGRLYQEYGEISRMSLVLGKYNRLYRNNSTRRCFCIRVTYRNTSKQFVPMYGTEKREVHERREQSRTSSAKALKVITSLDVSLQAPFRKSRFASKLSAWDFNVNDVVSQK